MGEEEEQGIGNLELGKQGNFEIHHRIITTC